MLDLVLLSAQNISMSYSERPLLNDVSIFIDDSDKIGLIGINGTGKSTLLKILANIEKPATGTITTASGVRIGYLPQNPDFSGDKTVIEQVFPSATSTQQELKLYEAKSILTKLGMTEFDKKVNLLSGGQKKRVAIAAALITPCDLLILDEPTNHLDSEMVTWLETMLQKLNCAILMVTHDRYFLDRVANRIVEIDNANLYSFQTNYTKFLELKAMREQSEVGTERKRQSILRRELEWIKRGPQGRGTKSKSRIDSYNELNEREGITETSKLDLSSITTRLGRKTVEINSITKSFDGKCMIKDFEYIITRDARIGIVGANGTGKSTLLNMITGNLQPDSGSVVVGDTVKIGYFSQECEAMDMSMKVIDYIKAVSENIQTVDGVLSATQMLERFLFPDNLQWNTIGRLSGGERRRLFLLRVIMDAPNILLLDEPTNDLDIQTLAILEEYLETFSGAVVAVSHDRYFLDRVVNSIFELSEGGVLKEYIGGYTDYITAVGEEKKSLLPQAKGAKSSQTQMRDKPKKLKFTFKEQFEYDKIDDEIAQTEQQIIDITTKIEAQASNYDTLTGLLTKKALLEQVLEEKMERWTYLNDLAERIEQEK
ncbi:MAG: ABC-F family ATP-binding cassette domain-containing protein [Oscillospiraceae bacterium]